MSTHTVDSIQPIIWDSRGCLRLLDQRRLPEEETYLEFTDPREVAAAITDLVVRGAPAIGITAAYAVVLSALRHSEHPQPLVQIEQDMEVLRAARPTAVNLEWALARMDQLIHSCDPSSMGRLAGDLLQAAMEIHQHDIAANHAMGELGASLIEPGSAVMTHCNAGALATGGYGTALGVIRSAFGQGRVRQVYAGETRPWLQGSRLTAWELCREQIPVSLVTEGAVAPLFREGLAEWLITGADRIAANGDVANKIGTYSAALHARHHGARVMVVAPLSTIDFSADSGEDIPIEQRSPDEILTAGGQPVAAAGAGAWNPVFDVTPAELVDVIVCETGIARAPFRESLSALAGRNTASGG
ncbi:MAG: S-methyl-5-thioribose-1-phosphate isomerase [Xanthomonadales bacterium]|nr:S-methyl-5-thioribose-1-phosphate isomerase [Xanthomonadales bacterium]